MCDQGVNLSVNGQSTVPPGFRFHPTEEELLHYYLRKKVACEKIDLDVIQEVDLNKLEPWDVQEKCKIGPTPQNEWYLFNHKDRKYPTGIRTNRATAAGFWKATGRDKIITCNSKRIGMRKTLVFYRGRAPQGQKSEWIMHEYRLDDSIAHQSSNSAPRSNIFASDSETEDVGWVVCKVFWKKSYHKPILETSTSIKKKKKKETSTGPKILLPSPVSSGSRTENGGILNQYVDKPSLEQGNIDFGIEILEKEQGNDDKLKVDNSSNFIRLSRLKTPTGNDHDNTSTSEEYCRIQSPMLKDWAAFDRFLASQLNGEPMNEDFDTFSFNHDNDIQLLNMQNSDKQNLEISPVSSSDTNPWSFSR